MKTRRFVESSVMLALATALSTFAVFKLPFGGSVTLFSQLPIIVIAYRYGTPWGICIGVLNGLIQLLLGAENLSYVTGFASVLILIMTDYVVAYGVLGLGGVFRKRLHKPALELCLGSALSTVLRYICHIISGVTIWSGYAPETNTVLHYSVFYNGSYMLPELIITIFGAALIGARLDLLSAQLKIQVR